MEKTKDNEKDKILIPKLFPPEVSGEVEPEEKVNSRSTRARFVLIRS